MIPFELSHGLVIIPVTFFYDTQRIETTGLLDTGSAGTALDINLVKFNFHHPSRVVEIVGVGGSQEVVVQSIEAISLGKTRITQFAVEFGDIAGMFGFNAIIGSDLLDALGACIDYHHKQIRFQK